MKLSDIRSPEDVKRIPQKEVNDLVIELRERITEVVSQNGGHLASNLGVTELTVALHRVFDVPKDKLIWDVGHQCYAHKLLTGRNERFDTLRTFGGLSGFPKCAESPYDLYETGHASTALSSAVGFARARDLKGEKHHVVAVVGDGAFTGGMCYEALNDAGSSKTRLIVVLNDNQMSISRNVGALSEYLSFLRTSKGWLDAKKAITRMLKRIPVGGEQLTKWARGMKNHVRNIFVHDSFFLAMGFKYLGPIDGQDEEMIEKMLRRACRVEKPVLLHIVTTKGAGYAPAEKAPDRMHGTPPFEIESGLPKGKSKRKAFSRQVGETLLALGQEDERIVCVSAAMAGSTGLCEFAKVWPNRHFDVGIAEEHAVTMAAGLAKGGMHPVVGIYDTFMQRAFDQVLEDVCLQNLPVTFLMDRAALGGEDGPTHHGVFGNSWMRPIPNLTLLYPRSTMELDLMLRFAVQKDGPVAIRYPKAEGRYQKDYPARAFTPGRWEVLEKGNDLALLALGGMVDEALVMRRMLKDKGVEAAVVNCSSVKPMDEALLQKLSLQQIPFVVMEEQQKAGGLGSAILECCQQKGFPLPLKLFALEDAFVPHGAHGDLMRHLRLTAQDMADAILKDWGKPDEKKS